MKTLLSTLIVVAAFSALLTACGPAAGRSSAAPAPTAVPAEPPAAAPSAPQVPVSTTSRLLDAKRKAQKRRE